MTGRAMRWVCGVALAFGIGLAAGAAVAEERIEPRLLDDGIYHQDWFLVSFLDLAEDLEEATAAGKRFVVFWEQANCPYCKDMHEINLADPATNSFIRDRFAVLQLDLFGAREVVDFDGEVLSESQLARKYRINFTPTLQFFPETVAEILPQESMEREVARMPGYFRPFHFLAMFEFVLGERYLDTDFQRYLGVRRDIIEARGLDPQRPIVD